MPRLVATITAALTAVALFTGPAWAEDDATTRKIRIIKKKKGEVVVAPKDGDARKVIVRSVTHGHGDPGSIVHEWLRDQLGGKADAETLEAWFKDENPRLKSLRDLFKKRGWNAKQLAAWMQGHAAMHRAHGFAMRAPSGMQLWGSPPSGWHHAPRPPMPPMPPQAPQGWSAWGQRAPTPPAPQWLQRHGPWMGGPQVSPWGLFGGQAQGSPWGFQAPGTVRWGMSQPQIKRQYQIWMNDGSGWRRLPGSSTGASWWGGRMPPMPPVPPMWGSQMRRPGPWGLGSPKGHGFGPAMGGLPSPQSLEQLKQQLEELRRRLDQAQGDKSHGAPKGMAHDFERIRRRLEGLAPGGVVEQKSEFVIRGPDGRVIQGAPGELSKLLKELGSAGSDLRRTLKELGVELGGSAPAPSPEKSDK